MTDDNLTVYENNDYQELLDQVGEELHTGISEEILSSMSKKVIPKRNTAAVC